MNKFLTGVAMAASFLAAVGCSPSNDTKTDIAEPATFTEGDEYRLVEPGFSAPANNLTEFFWYGCPHCYNVEEHINSFSEKFPQVDVVKQHTALYEAWHLHSAGFYALQKLGYADDPEIHSAMMEAGKNKDMSSLEAMVDVVVGLGVNEDDFRSALDSDEVPKMMLSTLETERQQGLTGVPSLIVSGKYILNTSNLSSWTEAFKVIEYLFKKEGIIGS